MEPPHCGWRCLAAFASLCVTDSLEVEARQGVLVEQDEPRAAQHVRTARDEDILLRGRLLRGLRLDARRVQRDHVMSTSHALMKTGVHYCVQGGPSVRALMCGVRPSQVRARPCAVASVLLAMQVARPPATTELGVLRVDLLPPPCLGDPVSERSVPELFPVPFIYAPALCAGWYACFSMSQY